MVHITLRILTKNKELSVAANTKTEFLQDVQQKHFARSSPTQPSTPLRITSVFEYK